MEQDLSSKGVAVSFLCNRGGKDWRVGIDVGRDGR